MSYKGIDTAAHISAAAAIKLKAEGIAFMRYFFILLPICVSPCDSPPRRESAEAGFVLCGGRPPGRPPDCSLTFAPKVT